MFTGLVEEVGTIVSSRSQGQGLVLTIEGKLVASDLDLGDSVSVNGVCLTADRLQTGGFSARVMPETARKTTLGSLRPGRRVNLERALAAGSRLGGHLVLGHVDGVGAIVSRRREGESSILTVEAPPEVSFYLVPTGSVTLEGVSLTVASLEAGRFSVSLVKHTLERTTLGGLAEGDEVNLEADILGKYVKSMLDGYLQSRPAGGLDREAMRQHGWPV